MKIINDLNRLERNQIVGKKDIFKSKVLSFDIGTLNNFNATIYALQDSEATLAISCESQCDICVHINDILVFMDMAKNVHLPVVLDSQNTIQITFSASCYKSVKIAGFVRNDITYPRTIALNDNLVGLAKSKSYIKDISSLNIGKFDIFAYYADLPEKYTFSSINYGNIAHNYYLYLYEQSIKVKDIDSGTVILSFSAGSPSSFCIFPCDDNTYDYCIMLVYLDCEKYVFIKNNSVVKTITTIKHGITFVQSVICSYNYTCACVKDGVMQIATFDVMSDNVSITYKNISKIIDCDIYLSGDKYYVVGYVGNKIYFKIIDKNTYAIEYSRAFNNLSAVFVHGGKLYGIAHNYLQVIYETQN